VRGRDRAIVAVLVVVLVAVWRPVDFRHVVGLAVAVVFFAVLTNWWSRTWRRHIEAGEPGWRGARGLAFTTTLVGVLAALTLVGSWTAAQARLPDQVGLCGRAHNSGRSIGATDVAGWGPVRRVGRSHGLDLYAPDVTRDSRTCQGQTTTVLFTKDLGGRWHEWSLVSGP
jgi:hypothetical protein